GEAAWSAQSHRHGACADFCIAGGPFGNELDKIRENDTGQMIAVDRIRLVACECQPHKREVRRPGVKLKVAVPKLTDRIELRLMADGRDLVIWCFQQRQACADCSA